MVLPHITIIRLDVFIQYVKDRRPVNQEHLLSARRPRTQSVSISPRRCLSPLSIRAGVYRSLAFTLGGPNVDSFCMIYCGWFMNLRCWWLKNGIQLLMLNSCTNNVCVDGLQFIFPRLFVIIFQVLFFTKIVFLCSSDALGGVFFFLFFSNN